MRLRSNRLNTVPGLISLLLAANLGWAQEDSQEKLKTWHYLSESVLDAPAKNVQIKTTNFGHQKSGS
jgi:hypothetical protein